jgi:hypothetical protein
MPLPKRGPHLGKRPPSPSPPPARRRPELSRRRATPPVARRGGVPQRRPGRTAAQARARERATRPGEAASPTGPRSSTQSPHHAKNRQNRTDRACTDARPRLQPPVPTPDSSPYPRLTPGRTPMVEPPVSNQTPTHPSRPPCPLPPPRPRPTSTRLGKPAPHLPGTSRKGVPCVSRGPPSSKAPAQNEKPPAGGAAACCSPGEQHLQDNRSEQQVKTTGNWFSTRAPSPLARLGRECLHEEGPVV